MATARAGAARGRAPRATVGRFSGTERLAHWLHAIAFFGMLATGLTLYLPPLSGVLGSRETVKTIHLFVAAGWVVSLLLVVALGDRKGLRASARELELFDDDDTRWLRGARTPQGRFNAGQKVHGVIQAGCATLFLFSGSLLWLGERNTSFRFASTILLHDALTIGATTLVLGHLYLALVHPTTRPALRGITLGSVRADWSRAHHAKFAPPLPAPEPRAARLRQPMTWILLGAAAVAAIGALMLVPGS